MWNSIAVVVKIYTCMYLKVISLPSKFKLVLSLCKLSCNETLTYFNILPSFHNQWAIESVWNFENKWTLK